MVELDSVSLCTVRRLGRKMRTQPFADSSGFQPAVGLQQPAAGLLMSTATCIRSTATFSRSTATCSRYTATFSRSSATCSRSTATCRRSSVPCSRSTETCSRSTATVMQISSKFLIPTAITCFLTRSATIYCSYTVKNAFAAREFPPLYKGLFPPISGERNSLIQCAGEFYPLYKVTHSTNTYFHL